MKVPFLTLKRNAVVLSLLVLYFLILIVPYYIGGYTPPVGFDTPWYIYNMRLIAEQGFPSLFEKTPGINLYSIFGYFISSVFHTSFVLTEKFLPITLATFFPLVNFQIVRKLGKSWRLSLLAMGFTIIDFNIVRMTTDLHRNLFSLLLVETALFLVLPDLLEKASKERFSIFAMLLVVAGLSHVETFALVMLTFSFLLVFYLRQRSFQKAKLLLLCVVVPCSVVTLFESPFLLKYLSGHILFDPSQKVPYLDLVAKPWNYLLSLGNMLIPFYFVGMRSCLLSFMKNRKERLLLIPLWNLVLIAGSFLPWLTIRVPGKRFLLLATVPPLASIGFAKLSAKESLTLKKTVVFITLIASASTVQFLNLSITYRPYISESSYEKLTWISSHKENKPHVFVLYFDKEQMTHSTAELNRHWVWAVIGTTTNVYFGKVEYLLRYLPTPSENQYMNKTSYDFWNELENLTLNGALIYLIKDWYIASLNQSDVREVHPDIYLVEVY